MKTERKTFLLPIDLIEEIKRFQKKNYHNSMTTAVIELIRRGLRRDYE